MQESKRSLLAVKPRPAQERQSLKAQYISTPALEGRTLNFYFRDGRSRLGHWRWLGALGIGRQHARNSAQFPLPDEEDPSRRDVIMIAAGGFAAVGLGLGLWPLLDQMNPDASALSMATTEVDLAPVEEGQAITVMWRGKPIFIRHRTKKEIDEAKSVVLDDLIDPIARNANLPESAPRPTENRPPRTVSPG